MGKKNNNDNTDNGIFPQDNKNNKHKMTTRSKRKNSENLELNIFEKKKKPVDVDEHGNIKGLIDYDYDKEQNIVESDDDFIVDLNEFEESEESGESEDSEEDSDFCTESGMECDSESDINYDDVEDDELIVGKLLSKFINKHFDKLDIVKNNKDFSKVFKNYSEEMVSYFLTLSDEQQEEIIKLENQIHCINKCNIPLRYQLLKADLSDSIKAIAMNKIDSFEQMDKSSGDYHKTKGWIEGLLKLPFGKYKNLPVSLKNTSEEISNYLINGNQILNKSVYGHKKAKCQILQIVAKWISNPKSNGSVFAIVGPMGNGKTTLIKEGVSKMINRPFEFITLGGATDSSYLDGHSYTYEGSTPGKIVDILKNSGCMNPVIYFDELDKVSSTNKGEEIINLLIHLTDFSQNDHFNDKYYSNVPLDLSKALFIFSLNDIKRVNPILRDRMYVIETDNFKENDKVVIARKYIIPKIFEEIGILESEIIFSDETIKYIITKFTNEAGVRNLKRIFETIISKINLIKITQSTDLNELNLNFDLSKIFKNGKIEFPINIETHMIEKLVEGSKSDTHLMMYT